MPTSEPSGSRSNGMSQAERRLRLADEAARIGSFEWSIRDDAWVWSAEIEHLHGVAPGAFGDTLDAWILRLHPDDRAAAERQMQGALASGRLEAEWRIVRPDGRILWIEARALVEPDAEGEPVRMIGSHLDITSRRAAEDRLRTLVEGIPQLLWRSDGEGRRLWSNPQWTALTGLGEERSRGDGWLEALHPDDRALTCAAWTRAGREQQSFSAEHRLREASTGGYRWFRSHAVPAGEGQDGPPEWLGSSTDVDDLRRLQARQALLLSELQHRVRNTLSVVRSIARRTAASSETVEDYQMHLDGRIGAFARVQSAMIRDPAAGLDLASLVADELLAATAQEGRRVDLDGPAIGLRPNAAEVMGLALHELATNAIKHGALASPRGHIRVAWRIEPREAAEALVLEWKESRVEPRPAGRSGFGTDLLERMLPYQLDARVEQRIEDDGLRCVIEIPLSEQVAVQAEA